MRLSSGEGARANLLDPMLLRLRLMRAPVMTLEECSAQALGILSQLALILEWDIACGDENGNDTNGPEIYGGCVGSMVQIRDRAVP